MPERGQQGFTLVELLIVIAILAVLAAVVIPNVAGMFSKGGEQAWDTDKDTLQGAVFSFYSDVHKYDSAGTWQDGTGTDGHKYPVSNGDAYALNFNTTAPAVDANGNPRVQWGTSSVAATDAQMSSAAIWMGLLVNAASANISGGNDGSTNALRASAAPITDEFALYLNESPTSAMAEIVGAVAGNGGTNGTYLWVVDNNGRVYSCYRAAADEWYSGYEGSYP